MEASKGSLELEREVLSQGLCASCGACVGICPYIKAINDRVALIEPCGIAYGQCYDFCPRTANDIAALDRKIFGTERSDLALGSHISIEMAQATDSGIRSRGQYGGVVSALMAYAIDSGEIGTAVVTRPFDGGFMPQPVVAEASSEVLGCSRTNYIASVGLACVNRALRQGRDGMGVVALPCQVLALRKMQASTFETGAERVKLIIGLFCTWALSYKGFDELLKGRADPSLVTRLDIPPPPANVLVVEGGNGSAEIPLDEVRGFIKPTCSICYDMTSEFADVSVGMVEGMDEWNTVITRTAAGNRLVDRAKEAGVIEARPLDGARLSHLSDASRNKKRRALAEIVSRTQDKANLLYLRLSDRERREFT